MNYTWKITLIPKTNGFMLLESLGCASHIKGSYWIGWHIPNMFINLNVAEIQPNLGSAPIFHINYNLRYIFLSPSSASYPFSVSFSIAAICAKLSLAKSICLLGMVIGSDLEPLRGFQAQSMVFVFIQTGSYVESTIHLKLFLMSQSK